MKIISGGQTGADRAALDAAVELGIDYGGSIPKGRLAEDGRIDQKYAELAELESPEYSVRTEKNVVDADATLVFTMGEATGGTAFTIELAQTHNKSLLIVDFMQKDKNKAAQEVIDWLQKAQPEVLNVAGPRESKTPGIYKEVFDVLINVLDPKPGANY